MLHYSNYTGTTVQMRNVASHTMLKYLMLTLKRQPTLEKHCATPFDNQSKSSVIYLVEQISTQPIITTGKQFSNCKHPDDA